MGPSAERSRTPSHIAETVGENMQGGGRVTDRAIDWAAPGNPSHFFFELRWSIHIKQTYSREVSLVLCSSVSQRAGQEQSWVQRWRWTNPRQNRDCWLVPDFLPQVERQEGARKRQGNWNGKQWLLPDAQQGPQLLLASFRQSHSVGQASQEPTIQLRLASNWSHPALASQVLESEVLPPAVLFSPWNTPLEKVLGND